MHWSIINPFHTTTQASSVYPGVTFTWIYLWNWINITCYHTSLPTAICIIIIIYASVLIAGGNLYYQTMCNPKTNITLYWIIPSLILYRNWTQSVIYSFILHPQRKCLIEIIFVSTLLLISCKLTDKLYDPNRIWRGKCDNFENMQN